MARDQIIPRDLHLFSSAQLRPLEDVLPDDWPGTWCDLARIFYIGLVNTPDLGAPEQVMAMAAMEQTRVAAAQMGGRNTYIPTCLALQRAARDAAICAEFKGDNISVLAVRNGITETRVHQILENARRKARTRLAATGAAEDVTKDPQKPLKPLPNHPKEETHPKGAATPFSGL